jgi:hypothetical protein
MGATMNNDERDECFSREGIQRLLNDLELARVSTREAGLRLVDGEELIDLEHLERGVRRAGEPEDETPMGRVLPRSAVASATWKEVLVRLAERTAAAPRTGG